MRHSFRTMSIAAIVLCAAILGTSLTSASAATANPAAATPTAVPTAPASPTLDSGPTQDVFSLNSTAQTSDSAPAQRPSTSQALCSFLTRGDYVHKSGSEASGHGWWQNINCRATLADVTVQLQEYYSDGIWRNKGSAGKARVRSSPGGRGNRATGRAACANSSRTGWRSIVDVDLVGVADSAEKLATPGQNIYCRR